MATPLMRRSLRLLYRQASDAHPGLLLQRGLAEHDEPDNTHEEAGEETTVKLCHIKRVCNCSTSDFYRRAYARWKRTTDDPSRFRAVILELQSRLFIGLTGNGMIETGCVIGRSHGAPCIPGSSIKGVVSALARDRLGTDPNGQHIREEFFGRSSSLARSRPGRDPNGRDIRKELFGRSDTGLSGLITFHDAWWVPGSAPRPLVLEVVTSHHHKYYSEDGSTPATDFDSPIPNAQVAVQGAFLFVIEGPVDWLDLAEQMLVATLTTRGIGAKTSSGYGLFQT